MQFGITKPLRWITHLSYLLLLALLSVRSFAVPDASNSFPDFTLPSAVNSYAQRLAEQRGQSVLLLLLKRCDDCGEDLQGLQQLANQYGESGLVTWVIWSPYKDDLPPKLKLPVLRYEPAQSSFTLPKELPAAYLINRDGVLKHQLFGSYKKLEQQLLPLLQQSLLSPSAISPAVDSGVAL